MESAASSSASQEDKVIVAWDLQMLWNKHPFTKIIPVVVPAGSETIVTQGCSRYCGFFRNNSKGYNNLSETATASCHMTEKLL